MLIRQNVPNPITKLVMLMIENALSFSKCLIAIEIVFLIVVHLLVGYYSFSGFISTIIWFL